MLFCIRTRDFYERLLLLHWFGVLDIDRTSATRLAYQKFLIGTVRLERFNRQSKRCNPKYQIRTTGRATPRSGSPVGHKYLPKKSATWLYLFNHVSTARQYLASSCSPSLKLLGVLGVLEVGPRAHPSVEHGMVSLDLAHLVPLGEDLRIRVHHIGRLPG